MSFSACDGRVTTFLGETAALPTLATGFAVFNPKTSKAALCYASDPEAEDLELEESSLKIAR